MDFTADIVAKSASVCVFSIPSVYSLNRLVYPVTEMPSPWPW